MAVLGCAAFYTLGWVAGLDNPHAAGWLLFLTWGGFLIAAFCTISALLWIVVRGLTEGFSSGSKPKVS
jgi:hypothetical protein